MIIIFIILTIIIIILTIMMSIMMSIMIRLVVNIHALAGLRQLDAQPRHLWRSPSRVQVMMIMMRIMIMVSGDDDYQFIY